MFSRTSCALSEKNILYPGHLIPQNAAFNQQNYTSVILFFKKNGEVFYICREIFKRTLQ